MTKSELVAFGKDANGEFQVYHLNLDNLAWMLAKHQEGKKVVIAERRYAGRQSRNLQVGT